jgi:hypothetical protein
VVAWGKGGGHQVMVCTNCTVVQVWGGGVGAHDGQYRRSSVQVSRGPLLVRFAWQDNGKEVGLGVGG